MERIPQSVTKRVSLKAYLSSDGISDATSKTIAVVISKNGAAFGNPSGGATNATEIGNGWYYVDLTTTDTATAGPLIVRGTSTGVDNAERIFTVTDAHNGGFDGVPSAVAGASGGVPLSVDASGRVDVLKVNGTSQTARDLGANLDVAVSTRTKPADTQARVTLVDTVTTYTGNTPQTGDNFARIGVAGAGLTALGDTRIAHLDADVSSRTKPADTQAAVTNLTNAPSAGDFTAAMKTSLNAATPAVTVSDKTGFSLSAAGILAIWHQLTSAIVTAGTIGKLLVDNIDAAISSRSTYAGGAVASVTAPVTAGTVTDKTGYALTAAYDPAKTAAQAGDAMALTSGERTTLAGVIWAVLTSALTTAGSIGKLLVDKIDATISSRSTYAGGDTAGTTTLLTRLTSTRAALIDNLPGAAAGSAGGMPILDVNLNLSANIVATGTALNGTANTITLDAGLSISADNALVGAIVFVSAGAGFGQARVIVAFNGTTKVATVDRNWVTTPTEFSSYKILVADSARTDSNLAVNVANAGAVWDEALSGHTVAGSAGAALSSAGAAADPWATSLPGAYGPGTAGDIIGNLDVPTADANADALLDRSAGVETGWTIRQSMRIILGVLAGKTNGANTTSMAFRDTADTKNRVAVTLDTNGNRTAVSTDAS